MKLSLDDVKTIFAPKVTAPEYVCVPLVNTLAAKFEVPLTSKTPIGVLEPMLPLEV
ncbi:hypothetical protein ABXT43_02520 [Candidatus Pelagibacter sp. Uisw_114]